VSSGGRFDWKNVQGQAGRWARSAWELAEQGAEVVKTEASKVDWGEVRGQVDTWTELGLRFADKASTEASTAATRARNVWKTHGLQGVWDEVRTGTADAVDRLRTSVLEGGGDRAQRALQELVQGWVDEHGPKLALERLKGLEKKLDAAELVADSHEKRAKTVPAYQGKPRPADAKVRRALAEVRSQVETALDRGTTIRGPDLYALSAKASGEAWRLGAQAFEYLKGQFRGEDGQKLWARIGEARGRLAEGLEQASPEWLKSAYADVQAAMEGATDQARTVLVGLDGVEEVASDAHALFERFEQSLSASRMVVDPEADAVGVGFLKEAAGLATGAEGKELVYIRSTGELRLVDLELMGARLGIGASQRPFARSLYGDADAIRNTERRHAGELGAVIFHAGVGYSEPNPETGKTVKSLHGTLGLGAHASVPLLGDQSLYSIRESTLEMHELEPEQRDRIEAMLNGASDSTRKWTAYVRDAVGLREPAGGASAS
jgi:hypothetical protein